MKCIGIFGGTFDPIHYGHLRTALEIQIRMQLDQVRFVPCAVPPHRGRPLLSSEMRLRMVVAATRSEPKFAVDDREIKRRGMSYTVDTLASLRDEFPQHSLGLILGMDAFLGLPTWSRWEKVLSLAHIIVAHRPGWSAPTRGVLAELLARAGSPRPTDIRLSLAGRVFVSAVTQLEISSTDLRNSIREGVDPRYLVPPGVRDIIISTESYATSPQIENDN